MKKWILPGYAYVLSIAFFFTIVGNIALWKKVYQIMQTSPDLGLGFCISLPIFIFVALTIIFNVLLIPYLHKGLLALLILISAITTYVMYNFGTLINPSMIRNVLLTRQGEVLSYFSVNILLWFFFLAVVPLILLCFIRVEWNPRASKELLIRCISIGMSIVVIIAIYLSCYESYASFARGNRNIQYLINPTNFIISTIRHFQRQSARAIPFKTMGLHAIDLNANAPQKNILLLVVGETSRSMNYALNGYNRNTNPQLAKENIINYRDFHSCGTMTAVSVPCMFSNMTRKGFDADVAAHEEGLLDVLKHAGVNIVWRDNDAGCKGVCDRITHIDMTALNDPKSCHDDMCYDDILLKGLNDYLQGTQKDTIVVLHLTGSHGPNYYQRYPKAFAVFKPTCKRRDIQNCSHQALVNTYDNTIVYNDYIISQLIAILKKQKNVNASMIYLSDHGESLGEDGLYLHGAPYFMAPKEETTIPFILWLSQNTIKARKLNVACLKQEGMKGGYSQDYLFSSVLNLMDIKTGVYNKNLDIFERCRR